MNITAQAFADNNGKVFDNACSGCTPQYISLNSETDTVYDQYYIAPHQTGGWKLPSPIATNVAGEVTVTKVKKFQGKTYYILATLAEVQNAFASCCGSLAISITPATLTCPPIQQCPPCTPNAQNIPAYTYYVSLPLVTAPQTQNGFQIYLYGNGTLLGTSPTFTTAAAALAWVTANWANFGTWALDSTQTQLQWTTIAYACGAMLTNSDSASYYLSLSALVGQTFNQIQENGTTSNLPLPVTIANSVGSANAIVAALQPYMQDGTLSVQTTGGNYYVQYTGSGYPQTILNNGTTIGSWAAGVAP